MWRVQYQHEGERKTSYYPGTDEGKEEAEQRGEYWRLQNNPTPEEKAEAEAEDERVRAYFEGESGNVEEVFQKHREKQEQAAKREAGQARRMETVEAVIKEGLRSLAKKAHPDVGGTEEEMQKLNAAVQQLRQDAREQQRIRDSRL
jgi:hypothetical protein